MSNPNPPTPVSAPPRWFVWLGFAALIGFGFFLALKASAVAGGADSSGYLNSARFFAAGQLRTELRLPAELGPATAENRSHFTPLGLRHSPDVARLAPLYPTGLPLHFAVAGRLLGWNVGPKVVIVLGAVAAVWLCYLVARELGLSRSLAAAAAVMLGAFPVFLFSSLQALSDTLATTWCLAATYFALRSRAATLWAIACGVAFSIAVLVRPTNILFAPALLLLLGADWRRLLAFFIAGVPAAVWLVFYNHHQYGDAFASGYGDVAAAFQRAYAAPTALHFLQWLAALLPAVVLVLPFVAFARRDTRTREALALAAGFGAIAGTYLCYEFSREVWWGLRFILPVVPALVLLSLLGVEALARGPGLRWPRSFRPTAAAILGLWAVGLSWGWSPRLHVFMVPHYEQVYADATRAAKSALPPNALVTSCAFSGAVYFYTELAVLRPDMVTPEIFARYTSLARAAGRPVCALIFDWENDLLRSHCPGNWTRIGGHANVGFWRLE